MYTHMHVHTHVHTHECSSHMCIHVKILFVNHTSTQMEEISMSNRRETMCVCLSLSLEHKWLSLNMRRVAGWARTSVPACLYCRNAEVREKKSSCVDSSIWGSTIRWSDSLPPRPVIPVSCTVFWFMLILKILSPVRALASHTFRGRQHTGPTAFQVLLFPQCLWLPLLLYPLPVHPSPTSHDSSHSENGQTRSWVIDQQGDWSLKKARANPKCQRRPCVTEGWFPSVTRQ